MDIPAVFAAIAREVAFNGVADIEECKLEMRRRIRAVPNFNDYLEIIVDHYCDTLVWSFRTQNNSAIKRTITNPERARERQRVGGGHSDPAFRATNALVNLAYENPYNIAIGGKSLGDLTGDEIVAEIDNLENEIQGLTNNLTLLRWLRERVRGDRRVRDVVSERTLRTQYRRIQEIADGMAEAGD